MALNPSITLYTYAMSPFAEKVHCCLLYKQLHFQCHYLNPLRLKKDLPVGHQIPVLTINGESRADSTPIAEWLDECFPEQPRLLPEAGAERERLLDIDQWISHRLIPGHFRAYPGEGWNRQRIENAWVLSHVMNKTAHGGLPWILRKLWPLIIASQGFIRHMLAMTDLDTPLPQAKRKLFAEFVEKLDGGPFLGGRNTPSLPDFSAFPLFAVPWMVNFHHSDDVLEFPEIIAWLQRLQPYLSSTPPLLPQTVVERSLDTLFDDVQQHSKPVPSTNCATAPPHADH